MSNVTPWSAVKCFILRYFLLDPSQHLNKLKLKGVETRARYVSTVQAPSMLWYASSTHLNDNTSSSFFLSFPCPLFPCFLAPAQLSPWPWAETTSAGAWFTWWSSRRRRWNTWSSPATSCPSSMMSRVTPLIL